MTKKQPDPLFLADQCEAMAAIWANEVETRLQAAALLRTQHAAIDRKDALLRQALKALEQCWNDDNWRDYKMEDAVAKAIKQELSQ